ncbi:hypothetical protein ACFO1B_52775 [Dactylosporangium siamense]|uniref:Uncharacterized protein n=1 Tax=Dactylosporangium siamense TaxID=685454 RepID=A0A919PUP2_9ACTN|nr:hypothetical protein [Dactylosporangium siamense]GIG50534.1 hypothetical protein Dsi01nite_085750 [Dactylosporangium siamense]
MTTPDLTVDPNTVRERSAVELADEIAVYESLEAFGVDEFDAYGQAETALENMLLAESQARSINCEHEAANELIDRVIELNRTMIRLAERERGRGADPGQVDQLTLWRDGADGLIKLLEGVKLTNEAEEARLAGNLDAAIELIEESVDHYADLDASGSPLAWLGELRARIAAATIALYRSLQETRIGNYRGARDQLDAVRVVYEELLADVQEVEDVDQQGQAILAEMIRALNATLVDVMTIDAVNNMLMSAQAGRFVETIEQGTAAAQAYETSILAARSSGPNRNMIAIRQMEMEYVQGWVNLATAEIAMDHADWDDAQKAILTARRHWESMARLGLRNLHVGVMAQRPDIASQELLLQAALRRLDRDRRFRTEINGLRESLHRTHLSNINVITSANADATIQGDAMSGDTNTFNGPVNVAGALGSGNTVGPVQQVQHQHADTTELRRLADQLNDLIEVLGAGPRNAHERESIERVRQAGEAARRGDDAGMRGHLASAGRWVLEVAERIGVDLAAAALRQSLGV